MGRAEHSEHLPCKNRLHWLRVPRQAGIQLALSSRGAHALYQALLCRVQLICQCGHSRSKLLWGGRRCPIQLTLTVWYSGSCPVNSRVTRLLH